MADESSTTLSPAPVNPQTYLPITAQDVPPGTPLAQSVASNSIVAKAKADSDDTTYCVGLAATVGVANNPVHCQYGGPLTLTTEQWDAVKDTGTGGLDHGAPYYISDATAGKITLTPPGGGHFVAPIGIALSKTTLLIQISFATASS